MPAAAMDQTTTWKVSAVIFDVDGVLLDTERLMHEVTADVVRANFENREYDPTQVISALGRAPRDAVQELIRVLELPTTVDEYLALSRPKLEEAWAHAPAIPGAARLVAHLRAAGVPMAVATSCDRAALARKRRSHAEIFDHFGECIATIDDVKEGKPAPDLFSRARELLGPAAPPPEECLVIEDAPAGVRAAHAAGMRAVALVSDHVPEAEYDAAAPEARMASLYEFEPALWGLPPFADVVCGSVPRLPPLRLQGEVVRGYGRGSKELGIPTANLPASAYAELLSSTTCGIYHGWAQIGDGPVHKMVASVGRNPYYGNTEKTVEPHLLHDFGADFYGERMRVLIVGYIRPEANFPSLEALIAAIKADIECARRALDDGFYAPFKEDAFFSAGAPA